VLGLGERAIVMRGTWSRKNIALKKYSAATISALPLEEWRQKLEVEMDTLCKLSNCYLVRMYGAVVDTEYIGVVLEEMLCSLCEVAFQEKQLGEAKKRRTVQQVTQGLDFLHGNTMVHGNLTTANVYLSHQGVAKIGSFGPKCVQSRFRCIAGDLVSEADESYAAPELLGHSQHLTHEQLQRADIYSLGIIAYEVMTGIKRFDEGPPPLHAEHGLSLSTNMLSVMVDCWEEDPKKRPIASQFLMKWKRLS
jgi:serine/threonine protein kinase